MADFADMDILHPVQATALFADDISSVENRYIRRK
jgi:hypothetical protein